MFGVYKIRKFWTSLHWKKKKKEKGKSLHWKKKVIVENKKSGSVFLLTNFFAKTLDRKTN